uniref:uncharacterized protein LOC120341835 n=1 Tax=Styela clava TaxID=7725 RepID=UPI00193A8667|nr:uncharacterized protein LOC120341835 [Styela clava]
MTVSASDTITAQGTGNSFSRSVSSKNPTTSSVAVNSCVQKSVVHGTAVSPNVTNAFEKESNIKSRLSDVKPLKVVDSCRQETKHRKYEPQITKNTAGEIITAENPNVCDIPDEAKDCQQMTNNPVCSSAGGSGPPPRNSSKSCSTNFFLLLPTSPKSVNSDDKSDKATETSCQQNISSGSDKPMRTENVQVNHRATVVKSPSRCTGTKKLVTDQYHHESWINSGNFLPSKPTPQSAVKCAEPVTPIRRDSNDQLENIQLHISPINTLNETFTSWHMPEAESCHGFLEVCMSVHPNSVYALRRIPYVKTTTIVTESTSSSANTMFVRGQPSFLGANEAGMELPTSSACATYIRLRDIISLLKIHYEALYSLVVRCDAGMFWPNAYAQKLFSFVYDPVCDTDGNMAKMTLRNVRSTKAQHFLGHMIILDKFLHCILPKFYHEGLGVLSCDVPKYVNVKIFKPISDIDKEVIKIFQKPYEYNSVLRGKDDRIKCKVMEKLKLPPDCNKNRKRSASNDSTDSVKRRKSCTPGLTLLPSKRNKSFYH